MAIKHEPLNSSSSYVIDLTSEEILASGNPGLSSKETPDMTTVYNSVPVKQSDVSRNVSLLNFFSPKLCILLLHDP